MLVVYQQLAIPGVDVDHLKITAAPSDWPRWVFVQSFRVLYNLSGFCVVFWGVVYYDWGFV